MKIEGSGYISQRHGSADPDPDPHQNVMDPQHCFSQNSHFCSCCISPVPDRADSGSAAAVPRPPPGDPYVFGLRDPDPGPLVRGMDPDPDPDPSISQQK
jgi:hypothetical protein